MTWPLDIAVRYLTSKVPNVSMNHLTVAKGLHTKLKNDGAAVGSIVHEVAEALLTGEPVLWSKVPDKAMLALDALSQWLNKFQPKVVAVEAVIYSEKLDYAGTFDSILNINGLNYLCDLKTSNASRDCPQGVYPENFIQLGAYLYAYEEQRQYELQHGGTNLVQIDDLMILSVKKDGRVDVVAASDLGVSLEDCMKMWESTWFIAETMAKLKTSLGVSNAISKL